MTGPIDSTNNPDIRALLGASATTTTLPDAVLAALPYVPRANRWAIRVNPTWATLGADDLDTLKTAAIYYAASLAVGYFNLNQQVLKEKGADFEYQNSQVSWEGMAPGFVEQAYTNAATLVGYVSDFGNIELGNEDNIEDNDDDGDIALDDADGDDQ